MNERRALKAVPDSGRPVRERWSAQPGLLTFDRD